MTITHGPLPAQTHVGIVRLQVADLARSIEFYRRVLGLRVMREGDGLAEIGDGTRTLIELHERPGVSAAPRRGAYGLFHFALLVPDRPALGRLLDHFVENRVPIGAADHLVSEALYLSDPDGLGIEVYRDRPRDEWAFADGELRMTTDPLDAQGLLAAAGGDKWIGMPEGTVMGHVHLHVGDLAAARTFYQGGLGLDLTVTRYPGALFLSAGGYHHHLGLNTWSPGPSARDDQARLLEWELRVPSDNDAAAAAARLRAGGFAVHDDAKGAVAADPWGTTVRIAAAGSPEPPAERRAG
jgi:catechol 2,3-dioxygenase